MRNASLRLLVLAGIVLLAVAALTGANRANATVQRVATVAQIDDLRQTTWRWQRLMRVPRTPTSYVERRNVDPVSRSRLFDLWRMRAHHAELRAQDPPHELAWRCIMRHETLYAGAWHANTGNGYYGGLQMDVTFQRHFAPELLRAKGTADNWSPVEQMWVAERAQRVGLGFTPWPNTARACGVL